MLLGNIIVIFWFPSSAQQYMGKYLMFNMKTTYLVVLVGSHLLHYINKIHYIPCNKTFLHYSLQIIYSPPHPHSRPPPTPPLSNLY